MKKFLPYIAAIASGANALFLSLQPINSRLTRLVLLASLAVFVICLFILSWPWRPLRIGLSIAVLLLAVVVALPGRAPDPQALRARYLAALPRYVDAPYVWGGEQASGIDCSGLPRKALRDALFQEGFRTLNGGLIREGLRQWWCDATAANLAAGYLGYAVPLREQGTIRNTPFPKAQPGDLAITDSGVHCLVYLHDQTWIQADPGVGKVAIFDVPKSQNEWFDAKVSLYRWSDFQ